MSENSAAPRSTNLITAGVLVVALAAVFFVGRSIGPDNSTAAATTTPTSNSTETFGIVTGGQASVDGVPDQLTFSATVTNTRSTTAAAMAATNHDVRAVTISAKEKGVAVKDIQTASLSIRPKYDYNYRSGSGPRIVGYVSTQRVKILVRKLSDAGKTIGAVTISAGNAVSISGVALSISNKDDLVAQARTAAVKKSKAAAEALAKAAGRGVGDLEYVEEVVPQQVYNEYAAYPKALDSLALTSGAVARSVAISPGKQQVSVTVKVRWALAR